jgi:hypothetical protein
MSWRRKHFGRNSIRALLAVPLEQRVHKLVINFDSLPRDQPESAIGFYMLGMEAARR